MTDIYVVTSGSYSDYGIECVFDSLEKAKEFVDLKVHYLDQIGGMKLPSMHYDAYHIEVYPLNVPHDRSWKDVRVLNKKYSVEMDRLGKGKAAELIDYSDYRRLVNKDNMLIGTTWALDESGALKIANDYRALLISEGLWEG